MNDKIEKKVSEYVRHYESGSPETENAFAHLIELTQGTPVYELVRRLPDVLRQQQPQSVLSLYQQLRIPGTELVIQDRRDPPPQGKPKVPPDQVKPDAKEGKKTTQEAHEAEKKKTETEKKVEKKEEQKAGETRSLRGGISGLSPFEAGKDRLHRVYELIRRVFEEGFVVGQKQPDGKTILGEKTLAGFREFFQGLAHRTIGKSIDLSLINNFRFRGLVPKGEGAIVISDLLLQGGKVEKYARFKAFSELAQQMRSLNPGDLFGKEGFTSEKLLYLGLTASQGQELFQSQKEAQGKFLSESLEARTAAELGISREHLGKNKFVKQKKGRSPFGAFVDPEIFEESAHRFVPWWQWGNLGKPGKPRFVTMIFYLSLLALALIGIGTLTLKFIP